MTSSQEAPTQGSGNSFRLKYVEVRIFFILQIFYFYNAINQLFKRVFLKTLRYYSAEFFVVLIQLKK